MLGSKTKTTLSKIGDRRRDCTESSFSDGWVTCERDSRNNPGLTKAGRPMITMIARGYASCFICPTGHARMTGTITMFDGLHSEIFPLRVWLVAPTKTRTHLTMLADAGNTDRAGNG